MIVLLNQQHQHLELKRMYFFQSLTETMIIIKRDFKQQNYRGYHKDSNSKYQKGSNRFWKDATSKVVKEDNVNKWGRKINPKTILEIRPDVQYVNLFIIGLINVLIQWWWWF